METDYLVLDFEFTVDNRPVGRPRFFFPEIIEVGAVYLNGSFFKTQREYQTFAQPRFFPKLTEDCKNITLIKQSDIDKGLPLEEMLKQLTEGYVPGKTMLVAWGDADRDVLGKVCQNYKISYPFIWEDYIDLATEYKIFYNKPSLISLKNAMEEQKITPVGIPHSALDDTRNTALILEHIIKQGWVPQKE